MKRLVLGMIPIALGFVLLLRVDAQSFAGPLTVQQSEIVEDGPDGLPTFSPSRGFTAPPPAESPWALPSFPTLPPLPPAAITRGFVPVGEFDAMEQRAIRDEAALIELQAAAAQRTLIDLETACRQNPVCASGHPRASR